MKPKKTPQEKKQLAYERDHRRGSHHGFWRDWHKKKASANRMYRKRVRELLHVVNGQDSLTTLVFEDAVTREALRKSIWRADLRKESADTLKDYVRAQMRARVERVGINKQKCTERHAGYAAFVLSLLGKRDATSADLKNFEAEYRWWHFREFLNQQPELLARVQQWYEKGKRQRRRKLLAIQQSMDREAKWKPEVNAEVS